MAELLCFGLSEHIRALDLAIMELITLIPAPAAHKLQGSGRLK
jgi:hypothetical protein